MHRAFEAGWGGAVWKTIGAPVLNGSNRYGAWYYGGQRMLGINNVELISDRPLDVNLREIAEVKRAWPDRTVIVSTMVESRLAIIERSKLDPARMRIGRNVQVIGAGNTAIDCATIARRLGAERVTTVYRHSCEEMPAYPHEFEFIKKEGVEFRFLTQPVRVLAEGGCVRGLACIRDGRRMPRSARDGELTIEGNEIVKAVGREKPPLVQRLGLATVKGHVTVSAEFETIPPSVFAGGECIRLKNAASTVKPFRSSPPPRFIGSCGRTKRTGSSGRSASRQERHSRIFSRLAHLL